MPTLTRRSAPALVLGYPLRVGLAVAAALAQIGEFSFILAALGDDLGVLPAGATNTLVAVAIVSISINPLLYRAVGPLEAWISRQPRLWRWLNLGAAARAQQRADGGPLEAAGARAGDGGVGIAGRQFGRAGVQQVHAAVVFVAELPAGRVV